MPFKGATSPVIFDAILNRQPDLPHLLNPAVTPELEHIIMKMLEKDRSVRYQTAADLLARPSSGSKETRVRQVREVRQVRQVRLSCRRPFPRQRRRRPRAHPTPPNAPSAPTPPTAPTLPSWLSLVSKRSAAAVG